MGGNGAEQLQQIEYHSIREVEGLENLTNREPRNQTMDQELANTGFDAITSIIENFPVEDAVEMLTHIISMTLLLRANPNSYDAMVKRVNDTIKANLENPVE